jgi:hypothetical protein
MKTGQKKKGKYMATISERFNQARKKWATTSMHFVIGNTKERLASKKFALKTDTGALESSIDGELLPDKDGFKVGTNVKYGRAWEFGFTRPAITIVPKRAKALAFPVNGKLVFAKRVKKPAKTFAPRPWLLPSIKACESEMQKIAEETFQEAIDKAFPNKKIEI